MAAVEGGWAHSRPDVVEALDVATDEGLDDAAVERRRREYGANELRQTERRSRWDILLEQFKSLVVLLLIAAAAVSFAFGEWIDATAILVVVVINAAIGFLTELRAVRSMEALQEMGTVETRVRRNGQVQEVPAEQLVPGDIVVLREGDVVSADLRLLEASKLQADESALTGESVPVDKQTEPRGEDTPLAERDNMVFKGTAITRGAGEGVVVASGMRTELGGISALVEEAEAERTPLEERLDQLGQNLIWLTLAVAAIVAVMGVVRGRDLFTMVETAIALAVAAIPEGLPIVATIALARGMRRMAQRNALVRRLAAVETLGGTNVICADKTGTLTENQMTVTQYHLPSGEVAVTGEGLESEGVYKSNGEVVDPSAKEVLRKAVEVGVLCNNASLPAESAEDGEPVGDPVEVALLIAGLKARVRREDLLRLAPEEREVAFDPDVRMMATFHACNGGYRVAVKGAPEAVLDRCSRLLTETGQEEMTDDVRQTWLDQSGALADGGLRVLALAEKSVEKLDAEPYTDLGFLGLVGLIDPPREEVADAIRQCQDAGVDVVMVTGDHAATARKVALAVGLVDEAGAEVVVGRELGSAADLTPEDRERVRRVPILARVSPEQKLDLIDIYQSTGAIVAMTGDGVNDAPALKKADIGVAMGRRGTQVAREAAAMVLEDDAFSTIVVAIEQGRVIFNNIRKFVLYLLSCNLSEIFSVGLASVAGIPLPILPLQILFLNVVTDVFPALALGVGPGDPYVMRRPPRDPAEPIVARHHWYLIGGYGLLLTAAVLGALGIALAGLGMRREQAVTVSFLTLAFSQLWHVFNMRDLESPLLRNEVTTNGYVWGALALCAGLLVLAVYLPVLSDVLSVVNPGREGWLVVLGMSLAPVVVGQVLKAVGLGQIQA